MGFTAIKKQTLGPSKEKYFSTFFWCLIVAGIFFVPYIILDKGYFLFYGDFNVQQIPFYQECHEAIRSGNIGWNWNTDLGVNFIGSYSFYTLGSPFFWLTLPFPNAWVPYMMGPLLILKFACSGLTAYCFIRRFTRTPEAARLGAILYAFSGFSVYNIFFNHFHEAIVFFPLLLLSVELLITENRRGFFAAMVAITAISNYFFFFGMVVFVAIYWFVRVFSGCYKLKFSRFMWFLFEAILGLLIAAAILVPTCYTVLANSRIGEISVGWNSIMYGKEQIYLNIFECFFFPPDIPARPVFFPDADVKWSSLGGWLPLFSMVGVFAFMQQKKHTWQRRLIGISIFMALVPILNSTFYMFNSAYYARWYYMPILIMALVTAQATEDTEIHWKSPFKWVFGITLATVLVFAFFPREIENGQITKWGLYTNTEEFYIYRFAATAAIALVSLVILGLLLRIIRKDRKSFIKTATALVCVISIIYSLFFIGTGKSHSYESEILIDDLIEVDINLESEKDSYRIDIYDGVDNTGMFLDYSTINTFHSVVPTSVTEFWEYVGEDRGVASRPTEDSYAARALLGVKYLLAREGGDSFLDDVGEPKIAGFEFYSHEDGYDVYKNKNYLPFGFAYKYYMTKDYADLLAEENRSNAMLKAILLTNEQVEKYDDTLTNIKNYGENTDEYVGTPIIDSEEALENEKLNSETASDNSSASKQDQSASNLSEVPTSSADEKSVSEKKESQAPSNSSAEPVFENEENIETKQDADVLPTFFYDEKELEEDVKELKKTAISSFTKTNKGFTAEITLENDNLVFFSVPYEDGWSATVNGKKVDIEKVNIGFMAVPATSGENEIQFTYETPGLKLGVVITLFALFVWILYFIICIVLSKKGKMSSTEYPEGEKLLEQFKKDLALEPVVSVQEEKSFDIEITDDSILYGYEESGGFSRGFWINTDDDQEESKSEEEE